jgi:hypothetical protein
MLPNEIEHVPDEIFAGLVTSVPTDDPSEPIADTAKSGVIPNEYPERSAEPSARTRIS